MEKSGYRKKRITDPCLECAGERLGENLLGKRGWRRGLVIRSNLAQSVKCPAFALAVGGTVAALGAGVLADLLEAFRSVELLENGFHIALVQRAACSEAFLFAHTLLCVLPFTTACIDDRKSGYLKLYLSRTNRRDYLLGRMTGCMCSGGLALVSGILLALGLAALVFLPMEIVGNGGRRGEWLLPFLQTLLPVFLSGAFWSMVGMASAAVTRSRYMAYAAPFSVYYLLIILRERYFKDCYILDPREWLCPERIPYGWAGAAILLSELTAAVGMSFFAGEVRRQI